MKEITTTKEHAIFRIRDLLEDLKEDIVISDLSPLKKALIKVGVVELPKCEFKEWLTEEEYLSLYESVDTLSVEILEVLLNKLTDPYYQYTIS